MEAADTPELLALFRDAAQAVKRAAKAAHDAGHPQAMPLGVTVAYLERIAHPQGVVS